MGGWAAQEADGEASATERAACRKSPEIIDISTLNTHARTQEIVFFVCISAVINLFILHYAGHFLFFKN